jgi:CRP-like cAMP-binding protein
MDRLQQAYRFVHADAGNHSQAISQSERVADPLDLIQSFAAARASCRDEEIFNRLDPAEYLYRVVSGVARDCAMLADGRRQIMAFLMPGDFFGFAPRDEQKFAVEAVVEGTVVARYPRQRVEILADVTPPLARRLRDIAAEAVARSQSRLLILGRFTALERVALFLMEMAERSDDRAAAAIVLPMSRYDIADYLALSVETICRTVTELKHRGVIALSGPHRVSIVDQGALRRYATGKPNAGVDTVRSAQPSVFSGVARQR